MNIMKWEKAKEVVEKGGKQFIMFSTEWCGDCKIVKATTIPNFEELVKNNYPDVQLIEVDAEEANLFKNEDPRWNVAKVPAFFTVNDGEVKLVGYEYLPVEVLEESLKKM